MWRKATSEVDHGSRKVRHMQRRGVKRCVQGLGEYRNIWPVRYCNEKSPSNSDNARRQWIERSRGVQVRYTKRGESRRRQRDGKGRGPKGANGVQINVRRLRLKSRVSTRRQGPATCPHSSTVSYSLVLPWPCLVSIRISLEQRRTQRQEECRDSCLPHT